MGQMEHKRFCLVESWSGKLEIDFIYWKGKFPSPWCLKTLILLVTGTLIVQGICVLKETLTGEGKTVVTKDGMENSTLRGTWDSQE